VLDELHQANLLQHLKSGNSSIGQNVLDTYAVKQPS
jgi:hypothetical protein